MTPVLDWSEKFGFGEPRNPAEITHICIHVTVNAPGTPAENVANYQLQSESGSYHELVDTRPVVLKENTDEWLTWSAGPTSNRRGLHRSFVMRGTETRDQWLAQMPMLRAAAARDAMWAKRHNIPVVKLSAADLRSGRRGFCGHIDTAQAWGETDHVDPGPGFPWDVYLGLVRDFLNPPPAPAPAAPRPMKETLVTPEQAARIEQKQDLILDQLAGNRDAHGQQLYRGWPQLGGRTVVDAVAAIGTYLGLPGFTDPRGQITSNKH